MPHDVCMRSAQPNILTIIQSERTVTPTSSASSCFLPLRKALYRFVEAHEWVWVRMRFECGTGAQAIDAPTSRIG